MSSSLRSVVRGLSDDSRFIAGWVGGEEDRLRQRLALEESRFVRLLLAYTPRPSSFATDVEAIADNVGVPAPDLAAGLREAAAIAALRQQPADVSVGLLAAARDVGSESPRWRTSPRIKVAVEDFWSSVPKRWRRADDLERVASLAAPVAVVALPRLSVARARDWLSRQSIAFPTRPNDRGLRAMILSWRGSSLLFVDGALDAAERRVSIAHELGHVWVDYLEQRRRVLRRAPDLLGILDGASELTPDDRARAALEGVPLGVQTHMLPRTDEGGASADVEYAEQRASEFALELLAPEREVAALLKRHVPESLPFSEAVAKACDIVGHRYALPRDEAMSRARGALELLERRPKFFER